MNSYFWVSPESPLFLYNPCTPGRLSDRLGVVKCDALSMLLNCQHTECQNACKKGSCSFEIAQ